MIDWIYASVCGQAAGLRARQISSSELVEAHLERIQAVNPKLNALVQCVPERARAEAQRADEALARGEILGPLHGIPVTIKDSLETEGIVSTGGTLGRKQFLPREDATVVTRLRRAGAIVLGKTNTPELTYALETDNLVYGRTNNPYDLTRTSGGSSGGAAALIAAGGSPLDLGSDTGGSIRLPAHFCGIAGIKPTTGRTPRTGHILPFGGHLDPLTQIGPMARRVEDLSLLLPIICGPDGHDPSVIPMPFGDPESVEPRKLRVAFYTDNGIAKPQDEIRESVVRVAGLLDASGMSVVEDKPACLGDTLEIFFDLFYADGCYGVEQLLSGYGTTKSHPWLAGFIESARERAFSGPKFSETILRWDGFRRSMLEFMRNYDLILCPPFATTAFEHDRWNQDGIVQGFSHTQSYNLCGWPALVLPCGFSSLGLPIGIQVVAKPWKEHEAIAMGAFIEERVIEDRPRFFQT